MNTRKRNCNQEKEALPIEGSKRLCIPLGKTEHEQVIGDKVAFREMLDEQIKAYPELFPSQISQGYHLHGLHPTSKKMPEVTLRRIKLKEADKTGQAQVYTVAPTFVLPYMTGYTDEVEKALFLHEKFGVPFWGLTYAFGRNDMYWYRLCQQIGGNSVVGTTVKSPDKLPEHLLADEKHTHFNGQKAYIAQTVGEDCVLGLSISLGAGEAELTAAYQPFEQEAKKLKADYQPKTVNTDGWNATQLAWKALFPTIVIIECFLHAFIKIRSCAKRMKEEFSQIQERVWNAYHADSSTAFLKQLLALKIWAYLYLPQGQVFEAVNKLCTKAPRFVVAYNYPEAYRTSNMIDRHMKPLDLYLQRAAYFNGHLNSAERSLRAWALCHNFLPYSPRAKVGKTFLSPAHQLNGFIYRDNWLENLLVSASMKGYTP